MKSRSKYPTVREFVWFCETSDACDGGMLRIEQFLKQRGEGALDLPARELIMDVAGDVEEHRRLYLEWFASRMVDEIIMLRDEDRIILRPGHLYDKHIRPIFQIHQWLNREMKNRAHHDPEVYPYVGRVYGESICKHTLPLLRLFILYTHTSEDPYYS